MACISRALIVGGGIAGLSTALALAKVGVHCQVAELADAPFGASVAFSGRAAEALDELGVYDEVHATGTPFGPTSTALTIRDAAGKVVSPGPRRPTWPGAKDNVATYRPVFVGILEEAAGKLGVTVRHGVTVDAIHNEAAAIRVAFSTGEEASFDLLIGADGILSGTRAKIFPDVQQPEYSGQLSIRWMAPGPAIDGEGWYVGPLGRIGLYYLPQDLVYVPAVIVMPTLRRLEGEELYCFYKDLLDSYTAPAIGELRKRLTPESNLIARPFNWILLPQPWHRGRCLIIGDAAHATTAHMGMGAGMAVEDAAVLGQCIGSADSLEAALDAFAHRRYPRASLVVETSVKLSKLEQAHAPESENVALLTNALGALAQPY